MRLLALPLVGLLLTTDPLFGQTPAIPVAPPPQAAPVAPAAAQPPRPFPEGAKVAFINVQRIASESAEGKASTAKVQGLNDQKVAELTKRNTALQEAQKKLQQSGSVLSDAVRGQLEKDIEKLNVDIQRFTQDAQAEVRELQEGLQLEFQKKLAPVIEQVGREKGLQMIFSQFDAGLVWADSGLDITSEIIKKLDAASPAPATPTAPPPVKK
jgi:outer membrane protein